MAGFRAPSGERQLEYNMFFWRPQRPLWLVHVPVWGNIASKMSPSLGSSSQLWLVYVYPLGERDIENTCSSGPPKSAMICLLFRGG
jgi:hypothetical protein